MKVKILAVFVICTFLFVSTTSAIRLSTDEKDDENKIQPCPAAVMIPGLWNTNYNPKENGNPITGLWAHVEEDESVTYKSEMSFYQFGSGAAFTTIDGKLVKIPSSASKIEITLKEKKDGGSWEVICEETITNDQAGSDGMYNHKFTKSYSEKGKYEVMVSADSFGKTLLGEEISWPSGGGPWYTMTTYVGDVESHSKSMPSFSNWPILMLLKQILTKTSIFLK